MIGIVSYGFYVPRFRIKIEEIARMWGKNPNDIISSLRVYEKAVGGIDEDSLTMAYEAASMALSKASVKNKEIRSVFFGSETPSYAVNPTSTILAEFLGIEEQYFATDVQFACKAATGAIITTAGMIASGYTKYGLVCAADKATGRPHDSLEYTAASGSAALLLGNTNVSVEIVDMVSFSSDTPDFWRREGIRFPAHGGRFTGTPSYFRHIVESSKTILKRNKLEAKDFSHAVFHMPNGKFPLQVARLLSFSPEQIKQSYIVDRLGNSYTATALLGLISVLEHAKKNDLIFMASYGSGAGSDAFILRVKKEQRQTKNAFEQMIQKKEYINYATYLKFMNII